MQVSPNLPNVTTSSGESLAIETAIKSMMISFRNAQRGREKISAEELKSSLRNQPPGSPKLSILSFKNADHGCTLGALSASHSNPYDKLDIPSFDWPIASYPNYKYPLQEFECYNECQDYKSLSIVEELIHQWNKKDTPIVGIIVEPIQNECTVSPSSQFFKKLQELSKKCGIYLMFDETKTGCGATGKFWCHEHFCLDFPADAVAFGGKTQLAGFFHSEELNQRDANRNLDTWNGDPSKLLVFETVIKLIESFHLMDNVKKTGNLLKKCLLEMEIEHYDLIHSTRGLGTFLAFNAQCPALRDDILERLRKKGVLCGKCGRKGITLRPSLTFNEKHASVFLDKLEEVIKQTELFKPPEKKHEKLVGFSSANSPKRKPSICDPSKKEDKKKSKGKSSICDSVKDGKKSSEADKMVEKKHSICDSLKARKTEQTSSEKSSVCDTKKADKKTDNIGSENKNTEASESKRMAHIDEVKPYGKKTGSICKAEKDTSEPSANSEKKSICNNRKGQDGQNKGLKESSICPRPWGKKPNS